VIFLRIILVFIANKPSSAHYIVYAITSYEGRGMTVPRGPGGS
jgi:hypothetical protein